MQTSLRDWVERNGHNHPSGAWLASDPDEGDYHRRDGYRMAGRLLLEQHCQRTSTKLIYPALAVYRHYYELQLKYLVGVAHRVLETPIPKTRGHDLIRLLPPIEEAITRVWGSDESEAFGPARLCAEFLTMIDPVGESMRYSSGRRGSTVQEATFLDPPRLIAMLEEGANLMDAADMGLNVWIDDRAEAR